MIVTLKTIVESVEEEFSNHLGSEWMEDRFAPTAATPTRMILSFDLKKHQINCIMYRHTYILK